MKIRRLDDLFAIDGITMFEEDNDSDSCYAVAGGILDASYLYDLMMTLLEDGWQRVERVVQQPRARPVHQLADCNIAPGLGDNKYE